MSGNSFSGREQQPDLAISQQCQAVSAESRMLRMPSKMFQASERLNVTFFDVQPVRYCLNLSQKGLLQLNHTGNTSGN